MTQSAMTREQMASRLRAIITRRGRMSHDWQLTPEGDRILSRLIPAHPLENVLTFDVNADRSDIEAVAAMPDDIDFLVDRVLDLGKRLKAYEPPVDQPQQNERRQMTTANYAGKIICNPDFQQWMFDEQGLEPTTDRERIKSRVRTMLRIQSLNDLNEDGPAKLAYFDMVKRFEAWNKRRQSK